MVVDAPPDRGYHSVAHVTYVTFVTGAGAAPPLIDRGRVMGEAVGEIIVVREDECYEGLRGSVHYNTSNGSRVTHVTDIE